jgi:hypothetical protein
MLAALEAGFGTRQEDCLWAAAAKAWRSDYLDWALKRLQGGGERSARVAALSCIVMVDPRAFADLCARLGEEGNTFRLKTTSPRCWRSPRTNGGAAGGLTMKGRISVQLGVS